MPQYNNLNQFCPRCGGKMYRISDLFGEYDNCLNCGYHLDIFVGPPVVLKPAWIPKTRARRKRVPSSGERTR